MNSSKLAFGRSLRSEFLLNSNYINLNHGAFGTYPRAVQADLHKFQARAEGNPDLWIRRDARKELNYVRKQLAELVNADVEDIVVVPNTTSGINAIMRSLVFENGSGILYFSTVYNSVRSIIQYLADYSNGQLTPVEFNAAYPITNDELVAAFTEFINYTPNIRLALIDHISASPGVIVPIERMIPILKAKGILVLIDGAHAIGQIPIDIKALAPDFYVTSATKWLYAARGTGVLYVDKKHQGLIHPAHIAARYSQPANFQEEFGRTGTMDYCPYMTVTAALDFRRQLGGETAIMNYTHNLAREGGELMAGIFGTRILQTAEQLGSMVDVEFPINNPDDPRLTEIFWVNTQLDRTNIFVKISKHSGRWWGRVSAQVYTDLTDFEHAANVLNTICTDINSGKMWLQ
jgi:selenocysteine lyase/cysteine desulfurase